MLCTLSLYLIISQALVPPGHCGLSLLQTTYLRSNYYPSRQIQSLWKGSETAIVQRSPKESGTEFRLFKYQRLSRCRCRRRCQGLFFCSKLEMKVVLKMLRFSQSLFCAMVRASVKTIERKPHLHFKSNKRVMRQSINFPTYRM